MKSTLGSNAWNAQNPAEGDNLVNRRVRLPGVNIALKKSAWAKVYNALAPGLPWEILCGAFRTKVLLNDRDS